jgi:hypothetical protein
MELPKVGICCSRVKLTSSAWAHSPPLIRFLARFMGVPDEEELKYTMDKISDNFSNYSAWHNRRYTIAIYGHSF